MRIKYEKRNAAMQIMLQQSDDVCCVVNLMVVMIYMAIGFSIPFFSSFTFIVYSMLTIYTLKLKTSSVTLTTVTPFYFVVLKLSQVR